MDGRGARRSIINPSRATLFSETALPAEAASVAANTAVRESFRQAPQRLPCFRSRCRHIRGDRKSTRLNSSHSSISYAVFCLKKKKKTRYHTTKKKKEIKGKKKKT